MAVMLAVGPRAWIRKEAPSSGRSGARSPARAPQSCPHRNPVQDGARGALV